MIPASNLDIAPLSSSRRHSTGRRSAFTLTELLVVIGIIVLLVGILLAALAAARNTALKTRTQATMTGFSQAAETYQLEHGRFPGLVPDRVLATSDVMTSMESAILSLMGGARVLSPQDDVTGDPTKVDYDNYTGQEITFGSTGWKVKIDVDRIGEGPYIDGKTYSPYFTPKESELAATLGTQSNETRDASTGETHINGMPSNFRLPDLIDGWGQPIIFARRVRSIGPLVGDVSTNPQYVFDSSSNALVGTAAYVQATSIGELGINQMNSGGNEQYSILQMGSAAEKQTTWSMILGHPSLPGEARGAFTLISAGADGIYFSRIDGPGSPSDPIAVPAFHSNDPSIVDEFDDVRVFGGN